MPIKLYCGLPRSGKSYSVTKHVLLPAIASGRQIISNMTLTNPPDIYTHIESTDLKVADIPPGALLVFDEAWRLFPPGKRQSDYDSGFLEFFAMHGHHVNDEGLSTEIILISQNPSQLNTYIRGLIDTTFWITKLNTLGLTKRYRTDIYSGCPNGTRPTKTALVNTTYGKFDKKVFNSYKSHTFSDKPGQETTYDKRAMIFRKPVFWLGFPIVLILAYYGLSGLADFFAGKHIPDPLKQAPKVLHRAGQVLDTGDGNTIVVASTTQPVKGFQSVVDLPEPTLQQNLSQYWRVVGHIQKPDGSGYIILAVYGSGLTRTIASSQCNKNANALNEWSCTLPESGQVATTYTGLYTGGGVLGSPDTLPGNS